MNSSLVFAWSAFAGAAVLLVSLPVAGSELKVQPFRVAAKLPDAAEPPLASIHIDGWLGARILANATNRLLNVDTEPLLAGYRKKPGVHPWIGEHVGKWMHAATLAWANTGDDRLGAKLDSVAADLIATQEPDGYLGTYVPGKRFGLYEGADWDVWSHKYNLLGLLTYYQYTGNEPALQACRKIGDLLINTFGPGKKSILSAGTHVGMAATSVLEPMVLLYRFTADERYLEFCKYIVSSWDQAGGPKILRTLLTEKQVNKTANGKAYEMLSNLVGLCELARVTGDKLMLQAALNAWQDIVDKRLYVTGSASQGEHFHADYDLPNDTGAHVAETCVTTTWLQLNLQLLRLTGQARFGNEIEKTLYNHLAAAQNPRGDDWCYFTALSGKKPYDKGINCCHSSGPRGMALAPFAAYLKSSSGDTDVLDISTFETSSSTLQLGGQKVVVIQRSRFPTAGASEVTFQSPTAARFGIRVRIPPWTGMPSFEVNGTSIAPKEEDGWAVLPARDWSGKDSLKLKWDLHGRVIEGQHNNKGFVALAWGPFVLAYDTSANPGLPAPENVTVAKAITPQLASNTDRKLLFEVKDQTKRTTFVPFADAGATGGTYQVWLRGDQ